MTRAPESEDPDPDAGDHDDHDDVSVPILSGIKGTVQKVCSFYFYVCVN